jgi:hypothetical protein
MSVFDLDTDGKADDHRELLESRPMIRVAAHELSEEGDETTVVVKIESGNGFLSRFRPAVMEKRYALDVFGTFVLRRIDTKRTVLDIVDLFKERFKLSRRESELGVVAFMKMLNQRHVINVIAATDPQD